MLYFRGQLAAAAAARSIIEPRSIRLHLNREESRRDTLLSIGAISGLAGSGRWKNSSANGLVTDTQHPLVLLTLNSRFNNYELSAMCILMQSIVRICDNLASSVTMTLDTVRVCTLIHLDISRVHFIVTYLRVFA